MYSPHGKRFVDGVNISSLINNLILDLEFKNKRLVYIDDANFFDNKNFSPFERTPDGNVFKPFSKYTISKLGDLKEKYDLIFASFPFASRGSDEKDMCLSSLDFLEKDGIGVYLMPSFLRTFQSAQGQKFKSEVSSKGYRFLAIINLPDGFLNPYSGMKCMLVFITSKSDINQTFFAKSSLIDNEVDSQFQSFGIANLYDIETQKRLKSHSMASDGSLTSEILQELSEFLEPKDLLSYGFNENISNFNGFESYEVRKEIEKLDSDYGGYKYLDLDEIAIVKATKSIFDLYDNAFYIPAIGKTDVIDSTPDEYSKKKAQNYFQIIVNDHRVLKDYLLVFFNSELGQQTIKLEFSKYEGATIKRLRMKDVKSIKIPIPNLGIQEEIVETSKKIKKLKELLNEIDQITSIRPISSTDQLSKLNQIYESSIELSDAEKTHIDIKKGESASREFKQTFSLDIKKKTKEDYIIFSSMKTIAGFLNTWGGTLYIGVADNGNIEGLEVEIGKNKLWKSEDKFVLGVKDVFKNKIGLKNNNFVEFKSLRISDKFVLKVICSKSDNDVFLDGKYYVRVGPSTEELSGPDMAVHIKQKSQ